MGRPTVYTDEAAEEILRRLAEGESLTRICDDDHLPSRFTVYAWALGQSGAPESFTNDYARARDIQAERYFDEVLDLADDLENAPLSNEVINARRVRLDSRKWVLARMNRAKYGDRSAHEISGPAGGELRFSWKEPASPSPDSTTEEGA